MGILGASVFFLLIIFLAFLIFAVSSEKEGQMKILSQNLMKGKNKSEICDNIFSFSFLFCWLASICYLDQPAVWGDKQTCWWRYHCPPYGCIKWASWNCAITSGLGGFCNRCHCGRWEYNWSDRYQLSPLDFYFYSLRVCVWVSCQPHAAPVIDSFSKDLNTLLKGK